MSLLFFFIYHRISLYNLCSVFSIESKFGLIFNIDKKEKKDIIVSTYTECSVHSTSLLEVLTIRPFLSVDLQIPSESTLEILLVVLIAFYV